MSYGITLDIWNESLRHSFVGASRLRHFITGNLIYGAIGALVTLAIIAAAGIFAFGFDIFSGGLFLAANMVFVFIFGAGIGMMIDALMVTKGSKYMAIIWIIPGLIMILSGVYYPAEMLPAGAFEFSMALPSTHCISSLRAAISGMGSIAYSEFLIGAGLAVVFFLAGGLLFKHGLKKSRESGVITKY
ncbi:MAG: ABC transporter permease, partial [Candidatus Aenigmatarchaeota archaeon]